jgi:NAD(P)-dependent dehydrogenase (short-subunit alcohol dehydrogenase family)
MAETNQTIVLITGANTGIGCETVKALLQSDRSYHVLMGIRDLQKGKQALISLKGVALNTKSTTELLQIDVSSDESISELSIRFKLLMDASMCY